MRDYTLEVELEHMPAGWVCFAIGEGKPVIAPPPVAHEIKALQSRLEACSKQRDEAAALVANANARLDEQGRRLGRVREACESWGLDDSAERLKEVLNEIGEASWLGESAVERQKS